MQWQASTRSQSILAKWSTNWIPQPFFAHSQSSQKPFVDDALPTWPSVTSALASSVGDAPSKLKEVVAADLPALAIKSKSSSASRDQALYSSSKAECTDSLRSVGWKKEWFLLKPSTLNRRYLCCFEPPCTRDLVEIIGCKIVDFATSKYHAAIQTEW